MLAVPAISMGQEPIPTAHEFDCYDILTDMQAPEYQGFGRMEFGKATKEIGFSDQFDVTGQPVILYTSALGAKLYEATPIVRFEHHSGKNLRTIWKSLRRGDLESGFPAFALSQAGFEWPGKAIVEKNISGTTQYSFDVSEFEIFVSYDVKLPGWYWNKTPSKKQFIKWKKYSCDIALHEKQHINPTREYMVWFIDEIPKLSAATVNDLRYQLNLLWQKTQKKIGDENIRIDTVTSHGQRRLAD